MALIRIGGSSSAIKTKVDTDTLVSGTAKSISLGFHPSTIHAFIVQDEIQYGISYDARISTTKFTGFSASDPRSANLGTNAGNFTLDLTADGFTITSTFAGNNTVYYVATE